MNNSIGKNAALLTGSKIITLLISMVSAMLLSRFRTLEEYGTYSQILMVINLVSALFMLGLPNSINFFLARAESEEQKGKFLSVYYTLSTFLSLIIGIILVLATPLIVSYFNNSAIKSFVYFLAVFPWTKVIMSGIENILIVSNKTKQILIFRFLNSIVLLLIILVVQFLNLTFSNYMVLYLISECIFTIIVYIISKKITPSLKPYLNKKLVYKIFKFSIPIGLATMVGTISVELDKLIIGKFLDTQSLAIYANAGRELPFTIISSSITAILMPRLVILLKEKQKDKAIALWGDATTLAFILISFFSVALIVFAPQAITILYSEKYLPGTNIFRIYSLILLLRVTYFGMILNSIGKTKFILYSSIISLLLNLILNVLCFKFIGFIGPAIATFISIFIVNFFQLFYTAKVINYRFSKIMPWPSFFKILILNIVSGAFIYILFNILKNILVNEILLTIGIGIIWMILYAIIIFKKARTLWKNLNEE